MTLFIPENLKLTDYRYQDEIAYLCHSIIIRRVLDRRYVDSQSFVPLKSDYLANIMGSLHTLYKVKKYAAGAHIIECDDRYVPGHKALGYRLGEVYRNAKVHKYALPALSTLNYRLEQHRQARRKRQAELFPLFNYLLNWLSQVEIDDDNCLPMPLPAYQREGVMMIRAKDWRV